MGDSDEDVLRAASSRSGDGPRLGGSTTMGAVDDLRRRVQRGTERPGAGNASSRGAGHGPATSRITGDGRSRIPGDRRRVSLAPPPLLGGADDVCGSMRGLAPPAWPPEPPALLPGDGGLYPPGYSGLPPAGGDLALTDRADDPGPPADWGEKLARAFVQRARAVHSGTAPEEGLSVRELLSLRSGRLQSSRSCKRLQCEATDPHSILRLGEAIRAGRG